MATQPNTDPFSVYGGKSIPLPSPASADPFAAYGGKAIQGSVSTAQPGSQSSAQITTPAQGLTDNPNGQGTYTMKSPTGTLASVPYGNVGKALDQGHLFADKGTLQQYARDHANDPLSENRVDQWLDEHPYIGIPVDIAKGVGTGILKTLSSPSLTPNMHSIPSDMWHLGRYMYQEVLNRQKNRRIDLKQMFN